MSQTISLDQALELRERGALFIDARSPAEYAEATIPGAINIPLLDDAERAEVGTLYKQQGRPLARRRGVQIVAPKIPTLLDQVAAARPAGAGLTVVFCWRGGMRSRALTQFLELAGMPARQLTGGHKAFRRRVIDFFETGVWGRMLVLRGLTGVGKTRALQRLAAEGYPVIDLEGLANHRGSAFGNLGLPAQPGQKMFEALLWDQLHRIGPGDDVLVEGESRHIGRVSLPPRVHQAMQHETSLWLNASLTTRTRNILADYPAITALKQQFVAPIEALRERLGRQVVGELLVLLDAGDWQRLVEVLMVRYYDPLYRHTLPERRIEIDFDAAEEGHAALCQAIDRLRQPADSLAAPATPGWSPS
ncbi:MAG: tRNA 2-selenouridine(34) synthase MnmH [Desulfuromonadales bacterium]|nr:tRNA 2-selenouridine(34) synthase MnmH [Desulfuromonadales bacterium]